MAKTTASVDFRALNRNLAELVDAGLLFVEEDRGGKSYTFKHALIQDAAYAFAADNAAAVSPASRRR